MEVYIGSQHNVVSQYIVNRPIMDLCLEEERHPGKRVEKWWWENPGLRLVISWDNNKKLEDMEY